MTIAIVGDTTISKLDFGFVGLERYRGAEFFRSLRDLPARTRYYHENHKKRWEKRYNKPYPECNGEFGTISGVRWINA